jgi:hypothetical protein
MIEIIEKEDEYRRNLPEDVFFAQSTKTHLNRPEPYEASKFSIENWFGCGVSLVVTNHGLIFTIIVINTQKLMICVNKLKMFIKVNNIC